MKPPEILHFQATERCNLACPGCYLPERTGPGASAALIAEKVFKPLAGHGVRHTTLTGGEPLLHPEFVEICSSARRVFDNVQVVTNGLLLNQAMFLRLKDAGVTSIKVSIDGAVAATHDRLRGREGAFEKTIGQLRSILALPEASRSGVELGSIATVHPDNVVELSAIASLSRELGLHHFLVQPYHPFEPVYPPQGRPPTRPQAGQAFLESLSREIASLKAFKTREIDFIDNPFTMLDKMVEFHVSPEGPAQVCGANRFVFVNSSLEVRGCLFCLPLASLERSSPDEVFSGPAWLDFQNFRRQCRECLMGCQFLGAAQRLTLQGTSMTQKGDFRKAERLFEASLAREQSVDALQGLSVALWGQGRLQNAEEHFREVLRLRPSHPFAGGDLCEVLRAAGRLDEALEAGAAGVQNAPSSPHAHCQYGLTLLAAGRDAAGLDHILLASRLSPEGPWIRFNLGMAMLKLGREEEALESFREAARLDPEVPWFHFRLGLVLSGRGQTGEALSELRRAVELAPNAAKPHLELGRLLRATGNEMTASEHLRRALEIDPDLVAKEFPKGIENAV